LPKNLNKTDTELEAIFDHLPDGVIAITAEEPLQISSLNSRACKILERSREEILGLEAHRVFINGFAPLLKVTEETVQQKRPVRNFIVELKLTGEKSSPFLLNTVLMEDDPAVGKRVVLILHDISESRRLKQRATTTDRFETLIGSTDAMNNVFSLIDTVAPTDAAVLVYGETGTGKELVARAIHQRSNRADAPFIPVHCSAITSSLLESDLFGHTKGAFTGAIKDRPGRFEMADGGTIFLDEVATLSPEIQISLLRVLQEKTIERVGGTKTVRVDVRVISATNRQLPELIRQGVFRKDLYYRIKVLQINLPPLRKRKKDIQVLADYFIERFNRQHGCNVLGLTTEAKRLLKEYPWPGNVRELENAVEHAVILGQSNLIEPRHLPEDIRYADKSNMVFSPEDSPQLSEAERIRRALKETAGNVTRAADILGIHRTTLWRKMREFDISRFEESH